MSRMRPLVMNENMKIYRRSRTWVMLGIVLAILLVSVVINKIYERPSTEDGQDYRQRLEQRITSLESQLNDPNMAADAEYSKYLKDTVMVSKHALENNWDTEKQTLWSTVMFSSNLITLLSIFTIVIAADIVAGEFAGGTIKLLLIRPVRRWKILLSKYLSTLLFALFGLLLMLVCAMIIGAVAYGVDGFNIPFLAVKDGVVVERSMFLQSLVNYGYECVSLVMMVTFAFMISSAFRSSSMAIGLSLGLMFLGNMITAVLQRYDWIKYFLFSNLNLRQYTAGREPVVEGMTMGFSIAMLILYFAAFAAVAWSLFTKRDVTA
ncbi:MAG: transporter permease [Paenibacillaceae bacterium]|nr:transporter permease [Paenibacillaceae bacterium]